jgi:c-di-GMP-binding flagellar brake protein YcgR
MPTQYATQSEAAVGTTVAIADGQAIVGRSTVGEGEYWAGVVVGWHMGGYCIHFLRGAPTAGEQVRVWYRDREKGLVSCEGRLSPVGQTAEKLGRLALTTSEPVAALGRRSDLRVSLPGPLGVSGVVGPGIKCRVVDVSAGGIGVVVSEVMSVGCVVGVVFEHMGKVVRGKTRVVNRRRQADGQYRCGLQALETEAELQRQLREVTTAVQEQQLKQFVQAGD